jgi:putative transposase
VDENEEDTQVAKKGHTEDQILRVLRQAEGGTRVADICREHGFSEATFDIWKKKYSGLGLSELRELRQLREENSKLKHLVADLSLDRHILQEIVQKKLRQSVRDRCAPTQAPASSRPLRIQAPARPSSLRTPWNKRPTAARDRLERAAP